MLKNDEKWWKRIGEREMMRNDENKLEREMMRDELEKGRNEEKWWEMMRNEL